MTIEIEMTLTRFLGFFEADGSILLMFGTGKSKTTLKPCIRISQKSNSNLLPAIKAWLLENGIQSNYEDWNEATSKGRARNLTITLVDSVRRLIELVKTQPVQFISQKQRDFFILDRVLNTPNTLSIGDKINLKKSMHKSQLSDPDLDSSGASSRLQLEEKYNLDKGSSRNDSLGILKKIDVNYKKHCASIEIKLRKGKFTLPLEWFSGLVDGDAAYYLSIQVKDKHKRAPFIAFQPSFTITMEKNALLTLQALKATIGSDAKIVSFDNHYQLWIRKQKEIEKLLELQSLYPPMGDHRLRQFNFIKKVVDLKKKRKMRDLNTVLEVIREAYAISENNKGRKRPPILGIEEFAKQIYG